MSQPPMYNKLTEGGRRQRLPDRISLIGGSLSKMTQADVATALRRTKARRAELALGGGKQFARGSAPDEPRLRDMDLLISGYEALLREMVQPGKELSYRGRK